MSASTASRVPDGLLNGEMSAGEDNVGSVERNVVEGVERDIEQHAEQRPHQSAAPGALEDAPEETPMDTPEDPPSPPPPFPTALATRLYVSHFLSTWNSRVFEFAAVLFLAAVFPDTLLPMSVYAVVRGVAAMVFAEAVGACIDRVDRLAAVRASILGQRVAVAVSCGVFWAMLAKTAASPPVASGLFAVAVVAACVEKLGSILNLVAVERDWVVVLTEGNAPARRRVSARLRRIDLFCKLVGPLAISLVAAASPRAALCATLGTSTASVGAEYFCIAVVYRRVPALRRRPAAWDDAAVAPRTTATTFWHATKAVGRRLLPFASLPFYVRHPAFLPSFALALLYLTVLSFSGQMVTFLLATGYTPLYVGLARTASTVCELSATWIAPRLMGRLGVVRGGIWSLSWQALWLTAATAVFWGLPAASPPGATAGATALAVGVALSRIGLWGYDLCAQSLVQDEVADAHRGAFSSAEAAAQNLFEVLAYATTIVWARPDQFRWPVVVSVAAVYTASALYTAFVRRRRGHLFHSPLPPAQRWLDKALSGRRGVDA
ncbi:solute carrier family 40 (iron-regulated transporter), member 1 [Sporothrix brasiliensis 5110]|uniref:Solute carrier family 40 member n=1 Tax=Sporothrix brasiliensis 5110 TaxID=1398154 RepID=A0A0C2J2U0_9PEZI|nr:solute carrier family 40 (iron-regulated transporter), member 1 [Sporothrix brasiliensis 5110]KIH93365.1 solute carrier family 40 (iron-regulated transporter), member 1 [Sporothrix brasiliensis 5110]